MNEVNLFRQFCTVSKESKSLDITLANVDRFSKFFHQLIRKKILYVRSTTKIFTLTAISCYTAL